MFAARYNEGPHGVEIMEGLVRNGADVKATNSDGVHTLYSHPQNIYLSLSTLTIPLHLYICIYFLGSLTYSLSHIRMMHRPSHENMATLQPSSKTHAPPSLVCVCACSMLVHARRQTKRERMRESEGERERMRERE